MHNIADIEGEDPVIGVVVFDSEGAASRDLELLLDLQLVHLLIGLEGNLELFLLRHAVLEEVAPLSEIQLTYLVELFLNAYQFMHDIVSICQLLLEYLYLVRDVVTTASI